MSTRDESAGESDLRAPDDSEDMPEETAKAIERRRASSRAAHAGPRPDTGRSSLRQVHAPGADAKRRSAAPKEHAEARITMSTERRERLLQLKRSIEDGSYKIDADKIASRMMRDIQRDE